MNGYFTFKFGDSQLAIPAPELFVPTFEIASNPTISLADVKKKKWNIINNMPNVDPYADYEILEEF